MAITSRKINAFINLIASLADQPTGYTATQLKAYWDSSPEELKLALNGLIDDLGLTTPGNSGAKNIGVESIAGLMGNDVQSLLEALKTAIDNVVLGQVPNGSLTNEKLATDIKVGSLASLTTTDKSSATGAINEIKSQMITVVDHVKIAEVSLGANTATITFSNIPQTYKNLILVASLRNTVAGSLSETQMTFNGSGGTNYSYQRITTYAATVTGSETLSASSFGVGYSQGNTTVANHFNNLIININDYTNASKYKTFTSSNFRAVNTVTGGLTIESTGGVWAVANAITSITLANGGQFATGSVVTLYGIK